MSNRQNIRNSLKRFVNGEGEKFSKICKAINVSGSTTTGMMVCDCVPVDGTALIEDVRLLADFQTTSTTAGFLLIPKENSLVLVNFINNEAAYVAMVSEVENIYLMGNNYGGIMRIDPFKTQYDANVAAIKSSITAALNIIDTQLLALGQAGGSNTAFVAAAAAITNLNKSLIESTKVLHGNSTLI